MSNLLDKLKELSEIPFKYKKHIKDEEIMELAKQGLCPHYVLTNPISNQKTYLFLPQEILCWQEAVYLEKFVGVTTQELVFWNFEKKEAIKDVPIELREIKDLYELPTELLNRYPSGIYFLCKGQELVYIGQSSDIVSRVRIHLRENKKEFDRVLFIAVQESMLHEVESRLINEYRPKFNVKMKNLCSQ